MEKSESWPIKKSWIIFNIIWTASFAIFALSCIIQGLNYYLHGFFFLLQTTCLVLWLSTYHKKGIMFPMRKVNRTVIIGLAERKSDKKVLPVIRILGTEICTLETFGYCTGLKVHRQWHPRDRYGEILTIPLQIKV